MPTADQVSASVAVVAAVLVAIEYVHQRRQAKLQRATELERRLDEDPVLRFAVLCLDWGTGALPVPAEYVAYVGQPHIDHDKDLFFAALRPGLSQKIAGDRRGLFYRQAFVALFNHLERTVKLIKSGHTLMGDLPQTQWVIHQIANWDYAGGVPAQSWFIPALDSWYARGLGDEAKDTTRPGNQKRIPLGAQILELAGVMRDESAVNWAQPDGRPQALKDVLSSTADPGA